MKLAYGLNDSKGYIDSTFTRIEFYESGDLMNWSQFKDGKLNGVVMGFYESGVLGSYMEYTDGSYNGWVREYYESGVLKSEFQYQQNYTISGANYFDNGQIIGELLFENGRLKSGVYYHRNGQKRSEGAFRYDKRIGPWNEYDSTGLLTKSTNYGDPVGDRIKKAQEEKDSAKN